jgi:EAL domain-containing protein (putative c-di-GMP-specific phosphodiesterase class I)/ActR/RegA family two-component response regulator
LAQPRDSAATSSSSGASNKGRILVADDDEDVRGLLRRVLVAAGYEVVVASDGQEAIDRLGQVGIDAVVSDISMPRLSGIELLRAIRSRDADVPVILCTGSPDVDSAIQAVKLGALQYLTKPVDLEELKLVLARAVRLGSIARLKQEALALLSEGALGGADRLVLEASFERALGSLWTAYQPIVRVSDGSLFGYEALLRSDEPSLPHPGAVLDAAERLRRLPDLGRAVRAAAASHLHGAPADALLFVNLHALDLLDESLFAEDAPLSSIASRVVLEITERAALDDVGDAKARMAKLRERGFRIAVDDLGAGYAGLTSFVTLEPELVKLDMSLVRGIDQHPTKRKLVSSVATLCRELGLLVVAEGVETRAELDGVIACGCDLIQGYFLAKPGRPFPSYTW